MSMTLKAARSRTGVVLPGRAMGDPGLFGAIVGGVKGGVGALVSGGNPLVGAARGAVSGFRGGGSRTMPLPVVRSSAPQIAGAIRNFAPPPPPGSIRITPSALAPGGRPGVEFGGRNGAAGMKLACPSGFHPNKSDYFLKDGTFVPKGSRCVKNRRRDPMNPTALRRAVSRINAGKVWQSKLREIETGKFTKAGSKKA